MLDSTRVIDETYIKRSRMGWLPCDDSSTATAEKAVSPCRDCEKHDSCKKMCDRLKAVIKKDGYFEQYTQDIVTILPEKGRFSNFTSVHEEIDFDNREYKIVFDSSELTVNTAKIFVEYFFKRRSLRDIADNYGLAESTIYNEFKRAIEQINKIIKIMQARKSSFKHAQRLSYYSDPEKAFLLSHCFGFSTEEVADILGRLSASQWQRYINKKRKEIDNILGKQPPN